MTNTSINDLQNDHKNARKRTDRSSKLIKESLLKFGAARSIVIDENNRILAGNGTIAGAKAAGIKNLKIIESNGDEIIAVKRTGLSEEEKVGLAIADNRTGDLSEWDVDILEQLSKEHDLNDFFDKKELDDILSNKEILPTEGLTDPDDVPEVPEEPITKEGDLYILGNHRLLCGDSTNIQHVEKLMDGNKADMVFTDPPYGIKYQRHIKNKKPSQEMILNDSISLGWLVNLPQGIPSYICTRWDIYPTIYDEIKKIGNIKNVIVWDKESNGMGDLNTTFAPSHEFIIYVANKSEILHGRRERDVWQSVRDHGLHPTQKPIELIEKAINNHTAKSILDFFGGSGSTLIAAERTNRYAYLMELDPKYCDVIVKRWEDFTGNKAKLIS